MATKEQNFSHIIDEARRRGVKPADIKAAIGASKNSPTKLLSELSKRGADAKAIRATLPQNPAKAEAKKATAAAQTRQKQEQKTIGRAANATVRAVTTKAPPKAKPARPTPGGNTKAQNRAIILREAQKRGASPTLLAQLRNIDSPTQMLGLLQRNGIDAHAVRAALPPAGRAATSVPPTPAVPLNPDGTPMTMAQMNDYATNGPPGSTPDSASAASTGSADTPDGPTGSGQAATSGGGGGATGGSGATATGAGAADGGAASTASSTSTVNGVLTDTTTGRAAFVGPNGEPGYDPNDPKKPAGGTTATMSDGRQVYYVPGTGVSDANADALAREQFGYMAWALDNPEIGPILRQAAKEGWSADRLKTAIQNTVWWKTTTATQRAWDEKAATDPATAKREVDAQTAAIQEQARKAGVNIDPARAKSLAQQSLRDGMSDVELDHAIRAEFQYKPKHTIDAATGRLAFVGPNGEPGYDPNDPHKPPGGQLYTMPDGRQAYYVPGEFGHPTKLVNGILTDTVTGRPAFIGPNGEPGYDPNDPNKPPGGQTANMPDGRPVYYVPGTAPGARKTSTIQDPLSPELAGEESQLKQIADQYLIKLTDQDLGKWMTDIVQGRATTESFTNWVRVSAQSMWPTLSAAIDQGMTVRQFLAPYAGLIQNELDIPAEQIDWYDPKWQRFARATDPKTGAVGAMDLYDAQVEIRTNPIYKWSQTSKGRSAGADMTEFLTNKLGAVA